MVVIVIQGHSNDSRYELFSPKDSAVESQILLNSKQADSLDEKTCLNELWVSSHKAVLDKELNVKYNSNPTKNLQKNDDFFGEKYFSENKNLGCYPFNKNSRFYKKKTLYLLPENGLTKQSCILFPSLNGKIIYRTQETQNCNIPYYFSSSQVDTEDSVATTKEEEWITKKKTDIITTRQIETRVKRKLIVEDGKIVDDSGPLVTTNTTEDTEKEEHSQTEHKNLGEDNSTEKWIEVPNPKGCVKEVEEKTVRSRQETEERLETENVKHLGDISDEGYLTVIKSGSEDFRQALQVSNQKGFVEILPKVIHQSQKTKKCIDKEDKIEQSSVQPGGKIINETKTTLIHEELGNYNISDDDSSDTSFYEKTKKQNFQKYRKTKEQDITEYLADGQKIGERLHYQAESLEGERRGDFFDERDNIINIPSKLIKIKLKGQNRGSEFKSEDCFFKHNPARNSSSFDQEEEAKKAETFKWLEHHFGSESTKSSNGSFENFEDIIPSTQNSFISVTMKSQPLKKNSISRRFFNSFNDDGTNNFVFSRSNDYSEEIIDGYEKKNNNDLVPKSTQSLSNYKSHFQNSQEKLNPKTFSSSPIPINEVSFRQSHKIEPYQKFQTISSLQREKRIPGSNTDLKIFDNSNYKKQTSLPCYQYYEVCTKPENHVSSFIEMKPSIDNKIISKVNSSSLELLKIKEPSTKLKNETLKIPPKLRDNNVSFDNLPKKKLYQRTRFAADIPLSTQQNQTPAKQKNKISESFRRIMNKLRSNSDTNNKKKISTKGSRSPSPNENTYENYNSLDNYEPLMTKAEKENYEPVAHLRTKYSNTTSYPLEKKERLLQRYYLGEDPFSSSIYGKEKEYEHNYETSHQSWEAKGCKSNLMKDFKTRTLGRFSKSTSGLINAEKLPHDNLGDRGGIKTLPRKFFDETKVKPVINKTPSDDSNLQQRNKISYKKIDPISHTSSMINVSIVNKPQESVKYLVNEFCGPAKPARTYRSKLLRSHSLNIQPEENSFVELYKSNPHFEGLKESPLPLKSPSIISEWSQNSGYYQTNKRQMSEITENENFFTKKFNVAAPELLKTHFDRDNATNNINMNFQNEGETKQKFINYNSSFRSAKSVNTKNSNSGRDIPQKKIFKSKYGKPLKIPVISKSLQNNKNNQTLSRSEDSGSEFAAFVKNESGLDCPIQVLPEMFPEKTLSVKKLFNKPSEWKNSRNLLNNQIDSDEKTFCHINNNNSNGVVIKVLNYKS